MIIIIIVMLFHTWKDSKDDDNFSFILFLVNYCTFFFIGLFVYYNKYYIE